MGKMTGRIITALIGLIVSVVMGCLVAFCLGVPMWMGAVGMAFVAVVASFIPLPNRDAGWCVCGGLDETGGGTLYACDGGYVSGRCAGFLAVCGE